MHLEEDIVKGCAEVGTVDASVAGGFGVVDVFAFGAVELDWLDAGGVCEAHGQQRMLVTHHAGAFSEVSAFVFLELFYKHSR